MTTIAEVLTRLDEIISDCKITTSRIGYFAVLYRQVTDRIRIGILNQEFEDNPRMEKLDILFAKRFIDAYELWNQGKDPSSSWRVAFQASTESNYLVLQHLFLGINAHINLDLGIAASETMAGFPLKGIENDFNKINSILSELVDGVKANISAISPIFGLIIPLAKGKDELLLNFSIQLARDGAWKFAGEYHLDPNKESQIKDRDNSISRIAEKLIKPGKLLSFLVKLIAFAEWKSVIRTIEKLEKIGKTKSPD